MWSVETGRLTGRSNVALEGNRMLDKIRVGVNKAYQDVFDRDTYVTAEKVRNEYLGMGMNTRRCSPCSGSTTRTTPNWWAR